MIMEVHEAVLEWSTVFAACNVLEKDTESIGKDTNHRLKETNPAPFVWNHWKLFLLKKKKKGRNFWDTSTGLDSQERYLFFHYTGRCHDIILVPLYQNLRPFQKSWWNPTTGLDILRRRFREAVDGKFSILQVVSKSGIFLRNGSGYLVGYDRLLLAF